MTIKKIREKWAYEQDNNVKLTLSSTCTSKHISDLRVHISKSLETLAYLYFYSQ